MTGIIKYLVALGIMLSSLLTATAGVQLRVQSGSRSGVIGVGDKFHIVYTLTNMQADAQPPSSVPGAKLLYFAMTGQSSSFTSVNGKTSQSVAYTYTATLKAEKTGSFSFGPVTIDGQKSNQVSYKIVSAEEAAKLSGVPQANSARSQASSGSKIDPYSSASHSQTPDDPKFIGKGNDKLFLRASLNKTSAYEQEALVYTVKLYSTYSPIKFIGATSAPKFDGFVIEESNDVSRSLTYEEYQGHQYATAVIARYIIFPQQSGKLTIKGNTYTVSTDEREYYQDPYYSTLAVRKPVQLNVTPNDLVINVKDLPSPKPADFSGGVGNFKITSSLESSSLKTNQAGALTYTITGSGNLKYIHMPDLSLLFPKQLEVYSPEVDVKANANGSTLSGSVKYDYSFMPLEVGSYDIPSVTLCFFNPATGKYERSVASGYAVSVGKGKESAKSQTKSTLAFDKELLPVGKLVSIHTPYISRFSYWLAYILPTLLLIGFAWYYRQLLARRSDVEGLRARRAAKMATRRLKAAAVAMRAGDTTAFYRETLKALWGYLSDKLKMPTSELNRQNVGERLSALGVDDQVVTDLLGLIDDCEFAQYASSQSEKSMKEVYDGAVGIINKLETGSVKVK